MPRETPPVHNLALTILLEVTGRTAKELAEAAGCAPSTISALQRGETEMDRARLDGIAQLMKIESGLVERAVFAATVVHPGDAAPRTPVDPSPAQRQSLAKAAAMAGREEYELVYDQLLREVWEENAERARAEGRELATQLRRYSAADQGVLIAGAPDYQHWGLAVALCEASEAENPRDPERALRLAELAHLVSQHVPGTDAWRSRLSGYCLGHAAHTHKAKGKDFAAADALYSRSRAAWKAGEDEAGLLSQARLLDKEASFRRGQNALDQAVRLHEEALAAAWPGESMFILLNKAVTLAGKGDYAGSMAALDQAEPEIDGEKEPRYMFALWFNRASNLVRLGKAKEALHLISQAQFLADRLRNDLDLIKTRWLEGNALAALGQGAAAATALGEVRSALALKDLPFTQAQVSLDLALIHLGAGRHEAVQRLAVEMLTTFQALKVERDTLAALILFKEASEKGAVTEVLVRRLKEYLMKVTGSPELKFDPAVGTA
ncbi:MAG TPA: hypothetical protein DD490_04960 [Acidobacteria bacterium]|nr:hypothetical protein [Acidobacteriota bacterium]